MHLYLEFDAIVRRFAEEHVRYAVAGAFAVGLHGPLRATEDMDFLVHPDDADRASELVKELGYRVGGKPWTFQNTQITLRRFLKPIAQSEDLFVLDFMIPESEEGCGILDRAEQRPYAGITIQVVNKQDLIAMKRRRGSKQDEADIARLEGRE